MRDSLIDKANRVVDKYIVHESAVMEDIASGRKTFDATKVETANDFRTILENYPDLKANSSIMKLLEQLETSETRLLKFRMDYSSSVAKYNAKIHNFPFALFRRLFRFEDMEIKDDEEEVVSDTELGI